MYFKATMTKMKMADKIKSILVVSPLRQYIKKNKQKIKRLCCQMYIWWHKPARKQKMHPVSWTSLNYTYRHRCNSEQSHIVRLRNLTQTVCACLCLCVQSSKTQSSFFWRTPGENLEFSFFLVTPQRTTMNGRNQVAVVQEEEWVIQ